MRSARQRISLLERRPEIPNANLRDEKRDLEGRQNRSLLRLCPHLERPDPLSLGPHPCRHGPGRLQPLHLNPFNRTLRPPRSQGEECARCTQQIPNRNSHYKWPVFTRKSHKPARRKAARRRAHALPCRRPKQASGRRAVRRFRRAPRPCRGRVSSRRGSSRPSNPSNRP